MNIELTELGDWLWTDPEGTVSLGLSQKTKQLVGRIIYLDFIKPMHSSLIKDELLMVVEADKLSFEIYMPFDGIISHQHHALNDKLDWYNTISEPDQTSWLLKLSYC